MGTEWLVDRPGAMEVIERDEQGNVVGYTAHGQHNMSRFRIENGEGILAIGFKKFKLTTLFGRVVIKEVNE